jgi:hypothetical protein
MPERPERRTRSSAFAWFAEQIWWEHRLSELERGRSKLSEVELDWLAGPVAASQTPSGPSTTLRRNVSPLPADRRRDTECHVAESAAPVNGQGMDTLRSRKRRARTFSARPAVLGADDGIRTRDPHLGKVMSTSAGDRCNRWSRRLLATSSAGDRWNRSSPLHWSSEGVAARRSAARAQCPVVASAASAPASARRRRHECRARTRLPGR